MKVQLKDGRIFRVTFQHWDVTRAFGELHTIPTVTMEGEERFNAAYEKANELHSEVQRAVQKSGLTAPIAGMTHCVIEQDRKELVRETAFQSYRDKFSKETGRKVSLGKALFVLFPNDKDIRKAFWDAYRSRKTTAPNGYGHGV